MIPMDTVWALDERAARLLSMRSASPSYMAALAKPERDRDNWRLLRHASYSELQIWGVLCREPMPSGGPPTYGELLGAMAVLEADRDPSPVLLDIDSPGGGIIGLGEVAAAVRRLSSQRRVVAYCNDLTCSAAYLLASQASEIVSSPNAEVGSIGVYCVVVDASKMAEMEGLAFHVISSGGVKGHGVAGIPVSDEYLAEQQKTVSVYAKWFIDQVSTGRNMSTEQARKLADGRVHVGQAAVDLGLVDRLSTLYDLRLDLGGQTIMTQSAATPATAPASNPAPAASATATTSGESVALEQVRTEVQSALGDVATARQQLEAERAALRLERAGLRVDRAMAELTLAPPLQARARELAVGLLSSETQVQLGGSTVAAGDAVLELLASVAGEGTIRHLLDPAAADEPTTNPPRTSLSREELAAVQAAGITADEVAAVEAGYGTGGAR